MKRTVRSSFVLITVSICLLAAVAASAVTYTWFSKNLTLGEETYGMSVKVTPNLVISNSAAGISSMTADATGAFYLDSGIPETKFTPATHVSGSGLKCMPEGAVTDEYTGMPNDENTALIALPTNDGKTYYVDQTVYIAATDAPIEDNDLIVSLVFDTAKGKDVADTLSYMAGSVDFYLDSFEETNYQGTLNLAGKDAALNDGTAKTSLTLSVGDIPQNTGTPIVLCMRFYFDGRLKFNESGTTRCYVNSKAVKPTQISFDVSIAAVPVSP